jgi:hypothetical protein
MGWDAYIMRGMGCIYYTVRNTVRLQANFCVQLFALLDGL